MDNEERVDVCAWGDDSWMTIAGCVKMDVFPNRVDGSAQFGQSYVAWM